MNKYTVRIQLRNATGEDYSDLHENMEEEGFSRFVVSKGEIVRQLPDAEYSFTSTTHTTSEVLSKAHKIASQISPDPKILVTKSAERKWKGLDQI